MRLMKAIKEEQVEFKECFVKLSIIDSTEYQTVVVKNEPELTIIDDFTQTADYHKYVSYVDPTIDVKNIPIAEPVIKTSDALVASLANKTEQKFEPSGQHFECDICSKKTKNKTAFIQHFLLAHCEDRFTCTVCSKKFAVEKYFKKHRATHNAPRKFKCLVCLRAFTEKSTLKSHMKKHIRTPVKCKICFRVFKTQNWLNFHLKFTDHNKSKRLYTCDICSKSYKTKDSIRYHFTVSHQPVKIFQCKICCFKFKSDLTLRQHIRKLNHTDTAKIEFKCSCCPETFSNKKMLNEHFQIHFDGKHYTCHICPTKYTRQNKLKPHLTKKHLKPIIRFKCELCFATFPYEITLKTHLDSHLKSGDELQCKQCSETFSNARDYRLHEIIHKKKLKCEFCYRSFLLPIIMDKHLEIHDVVLYEQDDETNSEGKEFYCDICSKVTSTKISIWKHLKSHSKLQCEFCLKIFKDSDKLRSHLNNHVATVLQKNKTYRCDLCSMAFQNKITVLDHLLTYHLSKQLYKSDFCSIQLNNQFRWIKHNKEHINNQRKTCPICMKCITHPYYETHDKLHAENKQPYSNYISTFWTCNLCNVNLITSNVLRKHLSNDHKMVFPRATNMWRCDVCSEVMNLDSLRKHLRKIHGKNLVAGTKKWKCIDCSMEFRTYGGAWKHMKKFHAERIYKSK